ncbi:MAG: hypothetical protein ACRC1H_10940 [Caldilineaceae bacterium]
MTQSTLPISTMQPIHQEVLRRITILATSIGAEFALRINGELHGPLAECIQIPGERKARVVRFNFVRDTGYIERLRALEPGGVYECTVDAGDYGDNFVATLKAYGIRYWGKDKYIVATNPREGGKLFVQVLRVEA